MAINSQKLLSSSFYKTQNNTKTQKTDISLKKELFIIRSKLIQIDKILLSNFIFQRKLTDLNRKQEERKKFLEREKKLETKSKEKLEKENKDLTPQLGFFDRINRFITFTLVGWLVNKFYKYLPDILNFTKKIEPVAKFLESFVGNVFNGIVNFIDWGYSSYDKVRDYTKKIGGDPFQKTFDDFSKNLNTFINLAIVAGMATMGGTDFGTSKKGGKPGPGRIGGRSGIVNYLSRDSRVKLIEKKYGNNAARMYETRVSQGGSRERALSDVRKRFDHLKYQGGLKDGTGPGKVFGRGFRNAGSRFTTKLLGKSGKRLTGRVFGRIPIIGGLVDFLFALWSGEPVGRAAAKGVGATIGSALGSFIPVPFAGTILGGILGDIVGGALYDTLIASQSKKPKIKSKATGGQVSTRRGKSVLGTVKRRVRKVIATPQPQKINVGSTVGGEKTIKKIFPEPSQQQKTTSVNPYGFVTDVSEKMGKIFFIGPLFTLFGKLLLGDQPDKNDYRNIGLGINAWINNAISAGILEGNLIKAFADGGIIESSLKNNISQWAEKSVEELVKNKVTEAINELRKNLGMKPLQESVSGFDITDTDGELGSASDSIGGARLLMAAGFPPLAAAILAGNIQAESGWRGQRTPWVLNDGAGTNKGLISWNRTRITNAERFLGKPLETASNAEQIKWIKEELKQYGLLDEFMNPQSTETQLKEASYKYIRWGKEGDRWKYSRQIYAAIQRGEQGTYQSPVITKAGKKGSFNVIEYITGDPNTTSGTFDKSGHGSPGNYHDHIAFATLEDKEKAKRALRASGIKIGSEFRPGDPGYHGKGLAIDVPGYQWGGKGTIGQKEYEGSRKVRSVLGLKDGGYISSVKKTKDISPIQSRASYDESGVLILIQPIKEIVTIPNSGKNKSTTFIGGGVNNTDSSKSQLFVG